MLTVASSWFAPLRDTGVHRVYGVVSDSLNHIMYAIRRTDGT